MMSFFRLARARWLAAVMAGTAAVAVLGCRPPPTADRDRPAEALPDDSPAAAGDTGQPEPPQEELQPGAATKVLDRAGDRTYDKTFDDLRFDIEPGEPFDRAMLSDEILALVDQHIRIRGYILPTAQQSGIEQFVLVRDNQECCFGQGAALFDCILVEMQPGRAAEFSIRPVAVAGTFDIQEFVGPDGQHLAIYHIAAESVE